MSEDKIPRLKGVEWLEHHQLFETLGKIVSIGREEVPVDVQSGGRYFGEPQRMPGSDHVSIVKPDGRDHESHRALVYFYQRAFRQAMASVASIEKVPVDRSPVKAITEQATAKVIDPKTAVPAAKTSIEPVLGLAGPIRVDEKHVMSLCEDQVGLKLRSVWKRGNGKPKGVVSVASGAPERGKAVVKVGETLTFAGGCQAKLIGTGRDSN